MLKALFALVATALFAGVALSMSLAELPVRTKHEDQSTLARSRADATIWLQAGLALVSLILGLWAWWKTGDDGLLIGALLIGAALPLLWSRLHVIRTLLALGAVAAYLIAFLWP